ncbi:aldo/keto reductase [Brevibacillus agri]|uniref:aldo/keto reductase n=1 Tax=Brevibacillus agri TaxID=51101 RepID=UPI001F5D7F04|nr:aldo/keto reductase [Brevibacillus agri]
MTRRSRTGVLFHIPMNLKGAARSMQTRSFGRDPHQVSLLGFGAQRIVDEHDCTEEQAIAIIRRAVEAGVNYFDTAPTYSAGQSETRVGLGLAGLRDRVWIATKTGGRTRDLALKDLEGSLKRLQTDYVDEWRMHNIMQPHDLEAIFAKGGALEAMLEAREQGLDPQISISGHTDPRLLAEAIRRFPFDSALVALSALDHFIYSFAHDFVPQAVEKRRRGHRHESDGAGQAGSVDRASAALYVESPRFDGDPRREQNGRAGSGLGRGQRLRADDGHRTRGAVSTDHAAGAPGRAALEGARMDGWRMVSVAGAVFLTKAKVSSDFLEGAFFLFF